MTVAGKWIIVMIAGFLSDSALAQSDVRMMGKPAEICSGTKQRSFTSLGKSTVASPLEDDYDVTHVKLDVGVSNANNSISGSATTTAVSVVPLMTQYVFELHPSLVIDSVFINGMPLTASSASYVRTVSLTLPILLGSTFIARVHYHGQPPNNSGIRRQQSQSWGAWVTYTMSEPYNSRDWWPCKQSLRDKIDSTDIWVTVPNNLKAGSVGLLTNVTPIGSTHSRYEWKSKYAIDYYLLSLAATTYVDYSYYMHFSNSSDSMLIQNYVYTNTNTLPFFQDIIDSTGMQVDYFSTLFGRYPFWEEKYGHCMAPFAGGMEHQTMTTLGFFESTLIAHELGHQWFGDHATCGTWQDIWLNEGFASYSEYLFLEHFYSPGAAFNFMHDVHQDVMSAPDGSVYVDDTTDDARIFDSRLTYNKGNSVVHMLHFIAGNDSIFFQLLKDYQQQFAFSTAVTSDFETLAEQVLGQNLDTFFDQWIYKEGFPIYNATWNQAGNWVSVQLDQSTSKPSSVACFSTPIELTFQSSLGDTTVLVYNNQPSQTFSFYWNKPMNDLQVDPKEWLLREISSVSQDLTLNVGAASETSIKVYPNPTTDSWHISGMNTGSTVLIRDMSGRQVYQSISGHSETDIPAAVYPSGIYLLSITDVNGNMRNLKLVKQ